jgi:hypothetical protein
VPTTTRTVTRTSYTTRISTTTLEVLDEQEAEDEASEFECVAMEVTNVDGAVLALGEDCLFTYEPAPPISDDAGGASTTAARFEGSASAVLRARQASCTPYMTYTATVTTTIVTTIQSTRTQTRTVDPTEEGFSCPEMAVTNAAGDELSLDEDCVLEFVPAPEETDSGSTSDETDSGGGGGTTNETPEDGVASLLMRGGLPSMCLIVAGAAGIALLP